jgi:hypothetical protein
MSTKIFETSSKQYTLTQYCGGVNNKIRLQITDNNIAHYEDNFSGYVNGISRDEALELGRALITWADEK